MPDPLRAVVVIPDPGIRTPGNHSHGHWSAAQRRAKAERDMGALYARQQIPAAVLASLRLAPRCRVRVVAVGYRLDLLNLFGAAKHILDGVLNDVLRVDDGSDWYVLDAPAKERGPRAVRIELEAAE